MIDLDSRRGRTTVLTSYLQTPVYATQRPHVIVWSWSVETAPDKPKRKRAKKARRR